MSDTKQFVFSETLRNVHQQYGPGYAIVNGTDNVSHTASGPGGAWTASSGSNQGRSSNTALFRKELTNSSGNSEMLTIPWGDGFQNMLTSKNGVPATKCRIDVTNGELSTGISISYGNWSSVTNGQRDPLPVIYDWSITEQVNGTDQITAKSISDNLPQSTVGGVSGGSAPYEIREFDLDTGHYIQGSGVTGGEANSLSSLSTAFRVGSYNTPGFYSNWHFSYLPYVAITATRSWEGNLYIIDGLNNDTVDFNQVTATLTCQAGIRQQAEAGMTCTTSLAEASANRKFGGTSATGSTSVTLTPAFKLGFTKNLQSTTDTVVTTANLALASATLSGSSAFGIAPTFKPGPADTLTAVSSATSTAGVIYDITGDYTWDSFNLNTYFETGFSVDDFVNVEGEYTWTFLATTAWDDWPVESWLGNEASWDNWPNDLWEKDYVVQSAGSMLLSPTFKLGDTVSYTGSFTVVDNTALEEAAEANLVSTFTIDPTASGVIDVTIAMTSAMSPSLTANISYALDDTPISITGAFTPVLTASAITDIFSDIDVAVTLSITPTFKPSGQALINTATEFDLSPTFKPAGLAALTASAGTLTVGRLFFQADPFNTIKINAETRTIVVPVENTQTLVMEENRVNIVSAETRAHLVQQETRSLKLNIPPMTNRFSTPRVRSNH